MTDRTTYLIRLWLPDRPGALGTVASRLGALRGDVTGLEIVERGGGCAIDELVVSLPSNVPVKLIVRELSDDDVHVEDVRRLDESSYDPQLDVLEVAAILLGAATVDDVAESLCDHTRRAIHASWTCVLDSTGGVVGSSGDRPNERWLASFVSGSPEMPIEPAQSAADTVWTPLPATGFAFVVGRDGIVRSKERHRIAALARIADTWSSRLRQQARREGMGLHPAGSGLVAGSRARENA